MHSEDGADNRIQHPFLEGAQCDSLLASLNVFGTCYVSCNIITMIDTCIGICTHEQNVTSGVASQLHSACIPESTSGCEMRCRCRRRRRC